MLYNMNIFGHREITLFPPSMLVSVAEILLRHLLKYSSKEAKLISNVLKGLIMVSDYNFNYLSKEDGNLCFCSTSIVVGKWDG